MGNNSELVTKFSDPVLQRFYENLPDRPYCSHSKRIAGICSKVQADQYEYIQLNHNAAHYLGFDMDYEGAALAYEKFDLPSFGIAAINPDNKHAHGYYEIPAVHVKNSTPKVKKLLRNVAAAYKELLCADKVFILQKQVVKNALCDRWDVLTYDRIRSLTELAESIPRAFKEAQARNRHDIRNWTPEQSIKSFEECLTLFGRNCTLFDYGRHYAYSIAAGCSNQDELYTSVFNLLENTNAKRIKEHFPAILPIRELHYISKSISKWTWEHRRDYKRSQWNLGIMGFERMQGLSLPQYKKEKKKRQSAAAARTNEIKREEGKRTRRAIREARAIKPSLTQKEAAVILRIPYITVRRNWIS